MTTTTRKTKTAPAPIATVNEDNNIVLTVEPGQNIIIQVAGRPVAVIVQDKPRIHQEFVGMEEGVAIYAHLNRYEFVGMALEKKTSDYGYFNFASFASSGSRRVTERTIEGATEAINAYRADWNMA